MAKNYSLKEAVGIIVAGTDNEQCLDIGRRFPLLALQVAKLGAKAPDELMKFVDCFPEFITANKINGAIKKSIEDDSDDGSEESEDDNDDEVADDEPEEKVEKPVKKAKKIAKAEGDVSVPENYHDLPGRELWNLLGNLGIRKDSVAKFGSKKEGLLKALDEYTKKHGTAKAEDKADDDEPEEEKPEAKGKYDGIKAMALYKMCKDRGIEAEKMKKAVYYIDLLTKADEDGDGLEDFEEDEVPEPKAKKAAKVEKKVEKPVKKAKKVEEDEVDDAGEDEVEEDDGKKKESEDDEWDI